jgi:hypothetical protein
VANPDRAADTGKLSFSIVNYQYSIANLPKDSLNLPDHYPIR